MEDSAGILQILGRQALSQFRVKQLLASARSEGIAVKRLSAVYCYFVRLSSPLDAEQKDVLLSLVEGQEVADLLSGKSGQSLVLPRLGTTSSWSTKATEILNRCGLDDIVRIERGVLWDVEGVQAARTQDMHSLLHDRMTESVLVDPRGAGRAFESQAKGALERIDVVSEGKDALKQANVSLGLALTDDELSFIETWFRSRNRNPTDAELVMFSQVNSEHCRHKIFNASWEFDGERLDRSLFSMIRETHERSPDGTLVAYEDNAAVIAGSVSDRFAPDHEDRQYAYVREPSHVVYKAETHNHPTAISPFPGAATGAGGEIRDEGATGRGGKPKAGVCGFSVSHLRVPGSVQPWENEDDVPARFAKPLQIMLEGPIGAASFNNEFGRPNVGGFFRSFETPRGDADARFGYHKPIMFAGGIGSIRPDHVQKTKLQPGDLLIVLGGPAMLIGLGGGAASSLGYGESGEDLDFASVQRSNPEMQRRCQEVIDRCVSLGTANPIASIHDVGAGGLSNALPELAESSSLGADIDLRKVPNDDSRMTPMQIWCNESQERYVLSVSPARLDEFKDICVREHCPFAVVGSATEDARLHVHDSLSEQQGAADVIDVDMQFLFGGLARERRRASRLSRAVRVGALEAVNLDECVNRVLRYPSVADKTFLITIGDRTVSGLVHRDQMVGPWQVPVADVAVTLAGYAGFEGEAMALGERSPLATIDAPASARMALGEALTNLRAAPVGALDHVRLSANWMAAAGVDGAEAELYDAVKSVAQEICPALGISIPVGKDSLSMRAQWDDGNGRPQEVRAPLSLIVTAFAALTDVRGTLTPALRSGLETELLLIDLGQGKNRMGMSALHQAFAADVGEAPDFDAPEIMQTFYAAIGEMMERDLILAYHDRSDGGLFAALCEMAFAGRTGLDITLDALAQDAPSAQLFSEELGAVIQVTRESLDEVTSMFSKHGLGDCTSRLGSPATHQRIRVRSGADVLIDRRRSELHRIWAELTWRMQSLRDNPECAQQEYDRILDEDDPGQTFHLPDSPTMETLDAVAVIGEAKPKVAIMREQGVNGQVEMAAAFNKAGFDVIDVLTSDLLTGQERLGRFHGMAICGGFSFGDVFGAGRGWAGVILRNAALRDGFAEFFADSGKFAFGVCNGCQVMASLKEIMPGAESWPAFVRNASEQFEARLTMVRMPENRSIMAAGLAGSSLPIAVAHGEGRAVFASEEDYRKMKSENLICMEYVDNRGALADSYPCNPNGSQHAVAGVTNSDGRITAMMPHPERVFRNVQFSWTSLPNSQSSPWLALFERARRWVR